VSWPTRLRHSLTVGTLIVSGTVAMACGSRSARPVDTPATAGRPEAAPAAAGRQPGTAGGYALQFSTYLGGSGDDQIRDVATDRDGNIYVVGGTTSDDFPTTEGAYDRTHNGGGYDVFVVKMAPDGRLLWSTLIGGPNYDRAYAVEVDAGGHAYVSGRAGAGFPVTSGAAQTEFGGGGGVGGYGEQDGFVAKVRPDGSGLVWATYFGTDVHDIVRDLDIDPDGAVYVTGHYQPGASYPAAVESAFTNAPLGEGDTVAAKFSPDGSRVEWARYLGGSSTDAGHASIRAGRDGSAYVLTQTRSPDAETVNAYDASYNGQEDLYLARITADGARLLFATYLGGSGNESIGRGNLAMSPEGDLFIGSTSNSPGFPTTAGAYQRVYASTNTGNYEDERDITVVRFSPDGRLLASTFVGGRAGDGMEGVIATAGGVYVSGRTFSDDFPTTADAHQQTLAGRGLEDAVGIRLSPDLSQLIFSTYLGTTDSDGFRACAVDPWEGFVLGGTTPSSAWPVREAAQRQFRGTIDGVVAKFRLRRP